MISFKESAKTPHHYWTTLCLNLFCLMFFLSLIPLFTNSLIKHYKAQYNVYQIKKNICFERE